MPRLKKATIKARRAHADSLFEEPEESPFEGEQTATRPLADRMRPRTLDEFVGQEKIVAGAARSGG